MEVVDAEVVDELDEALELLDEVTCEVDVVLGDVEVEVEVVDPEPPESIEFRMYSQLLRYWLYPQRMYGIL